MSAALIGYSPAGVAWHCYRQPGQTDAAFSADVETMRTALLAMGGVVVTDATLSAASFALLSEELSPTEALLASVPLSTLLSLILASETPTVAPPASLQEGVAQ